MPAKIGEPTKIINSSSSYNELSVKYWPYPTSWLNPMRSDGKCIRNQPRLAINTTSIDKKTTQRKTKSLIASVLWRGVFMGSEYRYAISIEHLAKRNNHGVDPCSKMSYGKHVQTKHDE